MEERERIRRKSLAGKTDDVIDQLRDLMDEVGYSGSLGICLRDDLADLSNWLEKWCVGK